MLLSSITLYQINIHAIIFFCCTSRPLGDLKSPISCIYPYPASNSSRPAIKNHDTEFALGLPRKRIIPKDRNRRSTRLHPAALTIFYEVIRVGGGGGEGETSFANFYQLDQIHVASRETQYGESNSLFYKYSWYSFVGFLPACEVSKCWETVRASSDIGSNLLQTI